jgi:hypothetical protein
MSPSSHRSVYLLDNQVDGRPAVPASVYRDYFAHELEEIEARWTEARQTAASRSYAEGQTALEHEHWDWRNKADSVEAGHHRLVALE